jgi:hypothetical protein
MVTARQYRLALNRALRALRPLLAMLESQGIPVTEAQRWAMAVEMVGPMRKSRSLAQQAALAYLAGQTVSALAPAPPIYPVEAVVDMLQRVIGTSGGAETSGARGAVTRLNRRDPLVVKQVGGRILRAAERHAQQPARDLVKEVADDSPGVGWARVLTGATSCYFCAMLASRGPVYTNETSALFRGGQRVDKYHDGCDCEAVLVTNYSAWEGRTAHRRLEQLWEDSTEKTSGRRSMNAFRRAYEAQTRSGQFRPDSFQTAQAA